MTTPITVTGTFDNEPYSLYVMPGDVWPTDRTPTSSKVAAIVLCSKGERYAPAPSCASVTLDIADPLTVLACLANETQIKSISPDTQYVPDPEGPPGSADGPSQPADFANGLSLLADFGAKVFMPLEPRDEHGRWTHLQNSIAAAKIAAHGLLKIPGVNKDSGLAGYLSTAAGAARVHDHEATGRALLSAEGSLNRLGPAVIGKPDGSGIPRQHADLIHLQDLIGAALQEHVDIRPREVHIPRTPPEARDPFRSPNRNAPRDTRLS
jgi:hypothetical protein